MGHRLSKITTRTGDAGQTGLGDGSRTSKDAARIRVLGDIDELNSAIGAALAEDVPSGVRESLEQVQQELQRSGRQMQELQALLQEKVRLKRALMDPGLTEGAGQVL